MPAGKGEHQAGDYLPADLRHIARLLLRDPGASQLDVQALCVAEAAGQLIGAYRRWARPCATTGTRRDLEAEVADVLIATAVFAERAGIDLDQAIARKLAVIYTRGWHRDTPESAAWPDDEYVREL
jgi:NTP pyrophosphatase (non-canonical NTP hydrolase)